MSKDWKHDRDLFAGILYWVSEVKQALAACALGEERRPSGMHNCDLKRYAKQLEEHFGSEAIEVLSGKASITFTQYADRCDAIFQTIALWEDTNDERCTTELSDVLFYTGEIKYRYENARELLVRVGYSDSVDKLVDELGADFGGFSWE